MSIKSISLELQSKVLKRMESSVGATLVGCEFGFWESAKDNCKEQRKKIKTSSQCTTPISATKLMRSQSCFMEKMKRLLSSWFEEMNQCVVPLSQAVVMAKVQSIYDEVKEQEGEG